MSLRRVGVLLGKELLQGPKNFIFIWAVVAPIVISLAVSLVFGNLFTDKPTLGVMDEGDSRLVTMAADLTSVVTKEYDTVAGLRDAVQRGAVDMGIVLPDGFDDSILQGEDVRISAYTWGESLAKERAILRATVLDLARQLSGREAPVQIESTSLGDETSIPWDDRVLPLVVLMAVFLGGLFLPAISVINEKEKKTLEALVTTPTTIEEVFVAKGVVGFGLGLFTGIVILVLNQAFSAEPLLLVLVMALGTVMASEIGVVSGALIKDTTTLFAMWKFGGILLFAPAFVYLFPQIPEWVAKVFPTYYLIQPVVEISQQGGGWPEIATSVLVLIGLDLAMLGVAAAVVSRARTYGISS